MAFADEAPVANILYLQVDTSGGDKKLLQALIADSSPIAVAYKEPLRHSSPYPPHQVTFITVDAETCCFLLIMHYHICFTLCNAR
jgi:hypothetical protein